MAPVMTVAELEAFFRKAFPDVREDHHARIEAIETGRVRMTLPEAALALRPGAIVSGPTLMALSWRISARSPWL